MKKTKMSEIVKPFSIREDCIVKNSLFYYFYRIFPPNISTMSDVEKQNKINGFYNVLKNIKLENNLELQILVIDKAENLSENVKYIEENMKPKFSEIKEAITDEITKAENQKSSIQRAFYIVVESETNEPKNDFTRNADENGILYKLCEKRELLSVLRSYMLREFGTFDLAGVEIKSAKLYEKQKNNKKSKPKQSIYNEELMKRILPIKMTPMDDYIAQGNFVRQTLLVKNMPASFDTLCMLTKIAQLEKSSMNIRISEMNRASAISLVNKQLHSSNSTALFAKKGTERIEADKDSKTITDFYRRFINDDDKIFKVNIFIEIYGNSAKDLTAMRDKVSSALSPITYEVLRFDMVNGFNGVFPLGKDEFKTLSNNIPGKSLAALYPFAYSSRNDPEGLLLGKTEDGGYMFVDFFLRDQFITSGSYFISGETGYGKSYLQKKIISQIIARGYSVFGFDNENEYSEMIANMGGTNINAISKKVKINPFQIRSFGSPDSEIYETEIMDIDGTFFQHLSWLKEFFKILIPEITNKELSVLMTFVKDTYEYHSINENTDFSQFKETDYPTFTDLFKYIEEVASNRNKFPFYKMISQELINNCLILIKECYDGSLSPMFNGHTHIVNANIINFNIQQLLIGSTERTQAYLFNVLTYIWGIITQRKNRVLMFVDELYLLCNAENMIIVKYLRDFIKRVRKYNSIIGTATQQISDCMDPKIFTYTSAFINSAAFKFFFNCGEMDFENVKKFFALTQGELEYVKKAQRKHCLLKAGASHKYNMIVGTLPYELALFGTRGGK